MSIKTCKVGIVGVGVAGARFVRALNYLKMRGGVYELVAICDKNNEIEPLARRMKVQYFTCISDFICCNEYDLIIVATNEATHYEVLLEMYRHGYKNGRVLVEKPITETFDQVKEIYELYGQNVYVNYLERCSDITLAIKNYICDNKWKINRISFNWGKNRIMDPRPTIGVVSELVHPIDLCMYIGNLFEKKAEVISANSIYSNFAKQDTDLPDTVSIILSIEDIIISGSCSFVWHCRRREIILYLSKGSENCIVYMYFDSPTWDVDGYVIYGLDPQGNWVDQKRITVNNQRTNDNIHMTKTVKLLEMLVKDPYDHCGIDCLPNILQSFAVQKVVSDIERRLQKVTAMRIEFGDRPIEDNRAVKYIENVLDTAYAAHWDTGY